MGLLLRMTFWFSMVLLALPFGMGADDRPKVGPIDALIAAKAAVGDVAGLCARQPEACETGREAFAVIGTRARESARIAYQLIEESQALDTEGTGSTRAAPPADNSPVVADPAMPRLAPIPTAAPR